MANVGVTLIVDDAQLKKGFDNDIKLLSDMQRATDQYNASAVSGARGAIQAQIEYGKQLGASAEQMRQLSNISTQLESKVANVGDRMATSAERGARGLSVMARQGTVTARSLNQIIAAGADIAFAFGPEGTIISAVLMVTAGIVSHFESAESKMEETIAKFNHSIDDMLLEDSPIDLAKARARAYIDELEAQAEAVQPELHAATARVLGNLLGPGVGDAVSGFFDGGANSKLDQAASKTNSLDAASVLEAPIHANDKKIEGLKKEEEQANAEVTTWREKVEQLKTDGKTAELKVAQLELAGVESEKRALVDRIHGLQQDAIDAAHSMAQKDPVKAEQFALENPIKDRTLTDFSDQDAHSDAAVSSKGAADRIAQMGKDDAAEAKHRADQKKLLDDHTADVQRANEMLVQLNADAAERTLQAHGLEVEADKARIVAEFQRKADEINKLVDADEKSINAMKLVDVDKTAMLTAAEQRRTELVIAAINARNDAVVAAEKKGYDKLRDEIAREVNDAAKKLTEEERKKQEALEKTAQVMDQVSRKMADDLVRGQEDMGKRLLKAAMEPEIKKLQGWALSQFSQAAAAGWADPLMAAAHLAAGVALEVGAAELGSLSGASGGGGSSGGGGGGAGSASDSTAAHLGATGSQQSGPLLVHVIIEHQDQNGRQIGKVAQQLQRLDDRSVPIRTGALS